MILFDQTTCISICLKNKNPYVALAAEDLRKDFNRVSESQLMPQYTEDVCGGCIVIEENDARVIDPIEDESFSIRTEGDVIFISASTYLGTMWGIYTLSEKVLSVDPCYLFNDLPIKRKDRLELADLAICSEQPSFGFRGAFLNDEDLLTGFRDGGGIRHIDYRWYGVTVAPDVIDMVVETLLRLKINLVIPASFLDIDNPCEKVLLDRVARRGLYISQHHVEPLGVSHFTLENYCKKFGQTGDYSYLHYPELLKEAWRYYVKKWAEYDCVVWQLGLRGRADRPVWEDKTPTEEQLSSYGDFISQAIETQRRIVLQETGGKARHFTTTLWMEGSTLMEKGCLHFDESVCLVLSDNGPNQMFGNEYHRIVRKEHVKYGIYYHLQYYDIGPHLAPQTGLSKLCYNIGRAYRNGDRAYIILNVSNLREFTFELGACAQLLFDTDGFSPEDYLSDYCRIYGENTEKAQCLIQRYFACMPRLDTSYLRYVHSHLFNYFYEEKSPGVLNFVLKDGLILIFGQQLISGFRRRMDLSFHTKIYEELKRVEPIYAELAQNLGALADVSEDGVSLHTRVKWQLYAETLLALYRWFIYLYEARQCYEKDDARGMLQGVQDAISTLQRYLYARKRAEYGFFEHWYRGELKMNIKEKLAATAALIGHSIELS